MTTDKQKTRYSEEELANFKTLILEKLEVAQKQLTMLRESATQSSGNDTIDTSPTFKTLEEGASTLSKEELGKLAEHQQKFIRHLEAALIRIQNKTYGICRKTGKLIPVERLRAVPHATLSMEAKITQ
jgi:RNA polymerase-binding transcription factor DksA